MAQKEKEILGLHDSYTQVLYLPPGPLGPPRKASDAEVCGQSSSALHSLGLAGAQWTELPLEPS